jgi:hypothetical protein
LTEYIVQIYDKVHIDISIHALLIQLAAKNFTRPRSLFFKKVYYSSYSRKRNCYWSSMMHATHMRCIVIDPINLWDFFFSKNNGIISVVLLLLTRVDQISKKRNQIVVGSASRGQGIFVDIIPYNL